MSDDFNKIRNIIKDIPIFWINLNRSIKRKQRMEKILNNINCKSFRVEAVDGNILDSKFLSQYKFSYRRLSKNIIGCALSHIKAVETAFDLGFEYCLILEDDATFDFFKNKTTDLLSKFKQIEKVEGECLILGTSCSKKTFNSIIYSEFHQCFSTNVTNCYPQINEGIAGAFAYMLNRKGMEKILNGYKKKIISVSEQMIFHKVNTFVTKPYFSHPIVGNFTKDNKSFIDNSISRHNSHNRSILRWKTYYSC